MIGLLAEVDRSWLPVEPGMPLLAVVGQSVGVDHEGNRTLIDRVGRPGANTLLIQDDASRNGWNAVDPFDFGGAAAFRDSMQRGLTAVDSHSRHNYWSYPHPLLEMLLSDQLLLDPNVPVPVLDTDRNTISSWNGLLTRARQFVVSQVAGA